VDSQFKMDLAMDERPLAAAPLNIQVARRLAACHLFAIV